uniref:protein-tyrosine-phosphatase n=1 Tax=Salmo trutta TaxID=8032 RepID=A0A674AGI8_SALTR
MDQQFEEIDSSGQWQNLYNEIRSQASDYSYQTAKRPENQNRNRYRDVSPYDHSRVKLENSENDYINASLVMVEEAQRIYILSQGPLKNTCSHFWLMVWEQNSKAVIMLNRIIEKGSEKCAQYWPTAEGHQLSYTDTGFVVTLVKEEDMSYYVIRVLELRNTETGETREIYHFHYTTWPDFGVPESPASFLNFLVKVRESGSLGPEHGPSVVHCSAGIGRSGTFSLVDTCLILMDKRKDPSSVDIQKVLLDMREYRMGLIQTPDQLRFSYRAVLEGAKSIMGDCSVQSQWRELSREDRATVCQSPPAPPPRSLSDAPAPPSSPATPSRCPHPPSTPATPFRRPRPPSTPATPFRRPLPSSTPATPIRRPLPPSTPATPIRRPRPHVPQLALRKAQRPATALCGA